MELSPEVRATLSLPIKSVRSLSWVGFIGHCHSSRAATVLKMAVLNHH